MPKRVLISGGHVLSIDPAIGELPRGDVLIEDDRIAAIAAHIDASDCETIDATGTIVAPGFVDTHRHTWQAPWRNIASDWSLFHYLWGMHTGLSKYYRPEDTYAGNLLGTLEALDSGITTMLDWSHNLATPEHADAAIQGLRDSGSRAIFAHGGGAAQWGVVPGNTVDHPEDARRIREQYFSSDGGLVTMALAIRGPQFTTEEVALHDWALANDLDLRITVHVGDGALGKTRPIDWLRRNGLLNDRTTYVHCCSLGDDELQMISDSGGTASVAADVEMQMGHGWPATGRLLAAGVRPSLSIDVCTSTGGHMFGLMRTAIGTQRALDNAANEAAGGILGAAPVELTCRDMLEFATIEGARAVGLADRIGSLTPGKQADVILVRADSLGMAPLNNAPGALVYNAHPGLVDTVLVAGRVVKRSGVLTDHDPARVLAAAERTRDHVLAQARLDPLIADISLGGSWIPRDPSAA
ncbi:MAG TPA: amidohydrolase family protein [Solirubrobacteraceae bacterium]